MGIELIMISLVLIVGFYMAWNIGANDVSNAMGTSVGSGALTLKQAICIAAILEFAGAFFLGANVSQTMQSGLIDPLQFEDAPFTLLTGMFSALLATSIWLQVASYFGWPVSTTHAIVGAILGFGIIVGGVGSVKWQEVGSIALSWILSPALSALFSYLIFSILQRRILYALNPIKSTKKTLPVLIGVVCCVFTISVLFGGLHNLKLSLTLLESVTIAVTIGLIAYGIAAICIKHVKIPDEFIYRQKQSITQQIFSLNKSLKHLQRANLVAEGETKQEVSNLLNSVRSLTETLKNQPAHQKRQSEYHFVEKMFSVLQIMSASYVAFAHGANDVANAIGPVAAALNIIKQRSVVNISSFTIPTWLLALGGLGIVIGLATWGWRVIQTIGKKITELTPTRGFSAEFGAAITILIASKLGLPISTTHCIVGSVLGVGLAKGISALNLRTLRDIVLSWVVTLPSGALLCVVIYYIIKALFSL